jgi:hypothetical protein
MPTFEITDNTTGKVVVVEGVEAPTEEEAEGLFAEAGLRQPPPITTGIGPITTGEQLEQLQQQRRIIPTDVPEEIKQIGREKAIQQTPEVLATLGSIAASTRTGGLSLLPRLLVQGGVAGTSRIGGELIRARLLGEDIETLELLKAGGTEVGFEAIGELATGGANKIISPFRKQITEEGRIALEVVNRHLPPAKSKFMRLFGLKEVGVLPAEFTESKTLDVLQNITEGSLIGGGQVQLIKNVQRPDIIASIMDDVANQFGAKMTNEEFQQAFEEVIEGKIGMSKVVGEFMFNGINRLVGDVPIVNISRLKTRLQNDKMVKALKEINLRGINPNASGINIIRAIEGQPTSMSFEAAKQLKTNIAIMAEAVEGKEAKRRAFAILSSIEKDLDKAIRQGLSERTFVTPSGQTIKQRPIITPSGEEIAGKDVVDIYNRANSVWKDKSDRFNTELLRSMFKVPKHKPEELVDRAFQNFESAKQLKKTFGKRTFDLLSQGWIGKQMKDSLITGTNIIDPDSLFDKIFGKVSPFGKLDVRDIKPQLTELMGREKIAVLERSIKALQTFKRKQGGGIGRVAISLSQPGALMALALSGPDVVSTTILGGPAVVGRLMTNPLFAKWAQNTAKLSPTSARFTSNMIRLRNIALDESDKAKRESFITGPPIPTSEFQKQQLRQRRPQNILSALGGR